MDALFAAIESAEAGPAPKRRRVASAETQALIDRLTAEEGLTIEGARKLHTGDVRCRPPTYASFARHLPQFRLRSIEDAARAEDIVMLFVHVHGNTMQRDKFRFNVDNYLNDTELRASVAQLKTLEDLQEFCKSRHGNQRIYDAPEERYRRMAGSVNEETPDDTIRDVIACMVTAIEQDEIKYQRVDLHEGLPDRLARIVKLGAGGAALSGNLIVELLASATQHLPMSTVTMQKPPIGAMFVFERERGTTLFKQDGHDWDIETHNSIMDNRITNYYAQSRAGNIQRRCYWDRQDGANGRFVFVHYVKPPAPGSRPGRIKMLPPPAAALALALALAATTVPALAAAAPAPIPVPVPAAAPALVPTLAAAAPVLVPTHAAAAPTHMPTYQRAMAGQAKFNALLAEGLNANEIFRADDDDLQIFLRAAGVRAEYTARRVGAAFRVPATAANRPAALAFAAGTRPEDARRVGAAPVPATTPAAAPPAPVPATAPAATTPAAAMLAGIKAIFQAPNTRMGSAIMRLAPITVAAAAGPGVGRDVCTVAAFLSGPKASDDEKNLHFGEIKELVLANRWNDALEYIRTVARTV